MLTADQTRRFDRLRDALVPGSPESQELDWLRRWALSGCDESTRPKKQWRATLSGAWAWECYRVEVEYREDDDDGAAVFSLVVRIDGEWHTLCPEWYDLEMIQSLAEEIDRHFCQMEEPSPC